MSERFYTVFKVSGPNAIAAEEAIIETLRSISWEEHRAFWSDEDNDFFDHDGGQPPILTIGYFSRQLSTEMFSLFVDGDEGFGGPVKIANGIIHDGRSEVIGEDDECVYVYWNCANHELPIATEGDQVTCPICGLLCEYGKQPIMRHGEVTNELGWYTIFDAPTELPFKPLSPEERLQEKARQDEQKRLHKGTLINCPECEATVEYPHTCPGSMAERDMEALARNKLLDAL